jgi:hypothetical protein
MSWVTITDYPNYEVSDAGEVRNVVTGKVLKGGITERGYHHVKLCGNTTLTHRIVAHHFIENPENKPCVDHIDRNRVNNHVSNLRWVTYSENQLNRNYYVKKTDGSHHIQITPCQKFQLLITGRTKVNKNFNTLEEAVAFRDQWMIDNPR